MEQERERAPLHSVEQDPADGWLARRGCSVRITQAAAVLWALLIVFGLLMPGGGGGQSPRWVVTFLEYGGDKLVHVFLFAVQAILLAASGLRIRTAVALTILFGGLLEVLQAWTGTRSGDLGDWVADAIGAAVLLLPFSRWFLRRIGP